MPTIDPTKTALRNKNPSTGFHSILPMLTPEQTVLDYGSGYFRHADYLVREGHIVSIYDLPEMLANFSEEELFDFIVMEDEKAISASFQDAALCIFVLNTMPDIEDRISAVKTIYDALIPEGLALFEVRSIIDAIYQEPYKDGFLVGKYEVKTFQKPYTEKELLDFVTAYANFSLVSSGKGSGSVNIIVKKEI
jgi:SAM-dependent methyltransferase